jgi:hypothetical protein
MIARVWGTMCFARLPDAIGEYLRDDDVLVRRTTLRSLILMAGRQSHARGQVGALLVQALENEGWGYHLWGSAADALADCYPDYSRAVPALTRLLREARLPSSRRSAADGLQEIARQLNEEGDTFDLILAALIEAREKETDEDVQAAIVTALGRVGGEDDKLLDALQRAEKSRFTNVSRAAARAIERIKKARATEGQDHRREGDPESEFEAPVEPPE